MIKVIDALNNLYTKDALKHWYPDAAALYPEGIPIEEYLDRMDEANVEKAIINANGGEGPPRWRMPLELVKKYVDQYPDRFVPMMSIDPLSGPEGVKTLENAVNDLGVVAAHFYPHWFKMSTTDPKMYPIYEKCVELDIPFLTQTCASFYSYLPAWVNRPLLLEEPAMHFPELKIVMCHGGWPWRAEAVMMAHRFPNVYLMPSVLYPKSNWKNPMNNGMVFPSWGPDIIDFVKTVGGDKVIFGTNFPVTDAVHQIKELDEIGLSKETKQKFLRDNALKVFNL